MKDYPKSKENTERDWRDAYRFEMKKRRLMVISTSW
jgi:hypothetical protein